MERHNDYRDESIEKEKCVAALFEKIATQKDPENLERQCSLLIDLGDIYDQRDNSATSLEHKTKAAALYNAAKRRTQKEQTISMLDEKLFSLFEKCLATLHPETLVSFEEWSEERRRNRKHLDEIRKECTVRCDSLQNLLNKYEGLPVTSKEKQAESSAIATEDQNRVLLEEAMAGVHICERYDTQRIKKAVIATSEAGEKFPTEDSMNKFVLSEDDGNTRHILQKNIIKECHEIGLYASECFKIYLTQLWNSCVQKVGNAPCKLAIIGLGSLARCEMTPYSDLEFAILIENLHNKKELRDAKTLLRNMVYLLHLSVLDLGETPLPSMAIQSLNDFYSSLNGRDWFYDDITPSGFKFDGAMPWACKTPLGRKQEGSIIKAPLELICTPTEMVEFLTEEANLREGYHLADMLNTFTFITGDIKLVQEFKTLSDDVSGEFRNNLAVRAVKEAIKDFGIDLREQLVHVKKKLYRLPSLLVNALGMMYNTPNKNSWEVLDTLESRGILSHRGCHHLKFMTSVGYGLRMITYCKQKAQKELLSFLPSADHFGKNASTHAEHHLHNRAILYDYFHIAFPFFRFLHDAYVIQKSKEPIGKMDSEFYDESQTINHHVSHYLDHDFSSERLQKLGTFEDLMVKASDLYEDESTSLVQYCIHRTSPQPDQDPEESMRYAKKALDVQKSISKDQITYNMFAATFYYAQACSQKNQKAEALKYLKEGVRMLKQLGMSDGFHMVRILNLIGDAHLALGHFREAISSYKESCEAVSPVASGNDFLDDNMYSLASIYFQTKDITEAFQHMEKCLNTLEKSYGIRSIHPHIARANALKGMIHAKAGEDDKASIEFSKCLFMYKQILQHPDRAWFACFIPTRVEIGHYCSLEIQSLDFLYSAYKLCLDAARQHNLRKKEVHALEELYAIAGVKGNLQSARKHLEDQIEILRYLPGFNGCHIQLAIALQLSGHLYTQSSDFGNAIEQYKEALHLIHQCDHNHDHDDEEFSINEDLLEAQNSLQHFADAIACIPRGKEVLRTLQEKKKLDIKNMRIIGRFLTQAAKAYHLLSDNVAALNQLDEAFAIFKDYITVGDSQMTSTVFSIHKMRVNILVSRVNIRPISPASCGSDTQEIDATSSSDNPSSQEAQQNVSFDSIMMDCCTLNDMDEHEKLLEALVAGYKAFVSLHCPQVAALGDLLTKTAYSLHRTMRHAEAQVYIDQALQLGTAFDRNIKHTDITIASPITVDAVIMTARLIYRDLGRKMIRIKQYPKAIECLKKWLQYTRNLVMDKDNQIALELTLEPVLELSNACIAMSKYDLALESLEQMFTTLIKSASPFASDKKLELIKTSHSLAECLFDSHRHQESIRALEICLHFDFTVYDPYWRSFKGHIHHDCERNYTMMEKSVEAFEALQLAKEVFEDTRRFNPVEFAVILRKMGHYYAARGNTEEALEHFHYSLKLAKNDDVQYQIDSLVAKTP